MHLSRRSTWLIIGAALVVAAVPVAAEAQGFGDRLRRRAEEAAKRKVEERTEKKAGEATDKALDKAECSVPGAKCEAGEAGGTSTGNARRDGAAATTAAAADAAKPGEGAWRNFDFVPGDRVIFAEDFMRDRVGDFPKRMTFKEGNLEIVEWQGSRYISTNTWSWFSIPLPETLPERFTLEFDYSANGGNHAEIYFVPYNDVKDEGHVALGTYNGGLRSRSYNAIGRPNGDEYKYKDVLFPVKIMADGQHVKVYMGDTRVANVPQANLGRTKAIHIKLPGNQDRAAMIGNIRIAAGGRALYDALAEHGRVATQGIYFDTGSDRIRPESTPTLKEIGTMLQEHADLKLVIEGHTDNVGDAAANATLSEKRAAAVRQYLMGTFRIDGARLTAKGLGASKPVAPNTTAEGRQQNRRVELVKS